MKLFRILRAYWYKHLRKEIHEALVQHHSQDAWGYCDEEGTLHPVYRSETYYNIKLFKVKNSPVSLDVWKEEILRALLVLARDELPEGLHVDGTTLTILWIRYPCINGNAEDTYYSLRCGRGVH
jgi:hypothetical protein